jgi:hypothetical protein
MTKDPMLKATLKELLVHFIIRSFTGFYNYDIDNIISGNGAGVAISIKDREHKVDWVYERQPFHYAQLIYHYPRYQLFDFIDYKGESQKHLSRDDLEKMFQEICGYTKEKKEPSPF